MALLEIGEKYYLFYYYLYSNLSPEEGCRRFLHFDNALKAMKEKIKETEWLAYSDPKDYPEEEYGIMKDFDESMLEIKEDSVKFYDENVSAYTYVIEPNLYFPSGYETEDKRYYGEE